MSKDFACGDNHFAFSVGYRATETSWLRLLEPKSRSCDWIAIACKSPLHDLQVNQIIQICYMDCIAIMPKTLSAFSPHGGLYVIFSTSSYENTVRPVFYRSRLATL